MKTTSLALRAKGQSLCVVFDICKPKTYKMIKTAKTRFNLRKERHNMFCKRCGVIAASIFASTKITVSTYHEQFKTSLQSYETELARKTKDHHGLMLMIRQSSQSQRIKWSSTALSRKTFLFSCWQPEQRPRT